MPAPRYIFMTVRRATSATALFLPCGVATFPLTLIALRVVASLAPGGRVARKLDDTFEAALTVSFVVWVLGAFVFYGVALYIERQSDCAEQRTTQLTY